MRKKEQILQLLEQVEQLKSKNQDLLDLTVRFGVENQELKEGLKKMASAAYSAVFSACNYGQIGSNSSWYTAYSAYGRVGEVYGQYIPKLDSDKDSMLWGDQKI